MAGRILSNEESSNVGRGGDSGAVSSKKIRVQQGSPRATKRRENIAGSDVRRGGGKTAGVWGPSEGIPSIILKEGRTSFRGWTGFVSGVRGWPISKKRGAYRALLSSYGKSRAIQRAKHRSRAAFFLISKRRAGGAPRGAKIEGARDSVQRESTQ